MSHLLDHLKNSNGTLNQGHQRRKLNDRISIKNQEMRCFLMFYVF